MIRPSTWRKRYADTDAWVILALTTAIVGLHGIAVAYQLLVRERNSGGFTHLGFEWVAYTVGPLLVEPLLLFVVLYVASRKLDERPSVIGMLPGLMIVVIVGTVLGQYLGEQLFTSGWTPLAMLLGDGTAVLRLDLYVLPNLRDLLVPPVRSVLTSVAALALAESR